MNLVERLLFLPAATAAMAITGCGGGQRESASTTLAASAAATAVTVTDSSATTNPPTTMAAPSNGSVDETEPPTRAPSTTPAPTNAASATAAPTPTGPFADVLPPTTDLYCDWARHTDAIFKRWMELGRSPSENEAYVGGLRTAWAAMNANAPDELAPAFPTVTAMYEFVWETLAESGFDLDAQQAEYGDEIIGRRDQTFLSAAHAIEVYGYEVCSMTPR